MWLGARKKASARFALQERDAHLRPAGSGEGNAEGEFKPDAGFSAALEAGGAKFSSGAEARSFFCCLSAG